jgi:hypothetical protein
MKPEDLNKDELLKDLALSEVFFLLILIRSKKMKPEPYLKLILEQNKNNYKNSERFLKEIALRN